MNKRDRIIEAAIELFQEKGIDKTTISDIVRRANMAQGTFYLYFPSKISLMPAIAEEMVAILMERMEKHVNMKGTILENISTMIDVIFQVTKEYNEVLAVVYAGIAPSEHLKEWEMVYDPLYDMICHIIDQAKEANEIQTSISSKRIAKLFIGLVESAAEQVYLYDQSNEKEAILQQDAVQQFIFDALKIDKN